MPPATVARSQASEPFSTKGRTSSRSTVTPRSAQPRSAPRIAAGIGQLLRPVEVPRGHGVVGGLAGGALGAVISPGGSGLLGAILGGAGGAALGKSVDRNNVRCR